MPKESTATGGGMLMELFHVGLYKRSQGRYARQGTFFALALAVVLGCWQLYYALATPGWFGFVPYEPVRFVIVGALILIGFWVSFRVVQMPRFADFLIAVEAEMNKVSWPSQGELWRSSVVVMVVIFALAGVLFLFDIVWRFLFQFFEISYG